MSANQFCMPWITSYLPNKTFNGYTLYTPTNASVVWLIDMQGRPVHCWTAKYAVTPYAMLLPNGNLLYSGTDVYARNKGTNAPDKVIVEVDWDGKAIWEYRCDNQHHAFYRMANGHTMYLGQGKMPDDMVKKVKGGLPGTENNGSMRACTFHEVSPAGKIVWEWKAFEHLDPDIDILCPLCLRDDWNHANSCFVMPDGDILTTIRHLSTVAIIDKKTGNIKWRWGVGDISHPHDPTLLDNGNILVFDNGFHRRGPGQNFSRVVEVNPKTNKIEWEYKDNPPYTFYSFFASGCQRLPNGNTLICHSVDGRFFEVTREGEKVWEYRNPFFARNLRNDGGTVLSNRVFRAYRYGPEYSGLKGKVLDPDKVELALRQKD